MSEDNDDLKENESFDSGDVESVKTRTQKDKNKSKQEETDLLCLMNMPEGRRFVWKQLVEGGIFRLSFNQSALKMALNEGRRSVALNLFLDLQSLCPDLYSVMAKECSLNK